MEAVLTPEEIRDVNTRYHDVAAASYDSKWGIDFGDGRPGPGPGQAPQARRPRARPRLSALVGDRRRHRVLQPEPPPGRCGRRGDLHRHLARDGAHARRQRRPARSRRACDPGRRRVAAVRRRELRPRARSRGASPPAEPRPGVCRVPPGARPRGPDRVRRRAFALRRSARVRAQARSGGGGAAVASGAAGALRAAPCRAGLARGSRARARALRRHPRLRPRRAVARSPRQAGFEPGQGPRRGARGQLVRLVQPHARGDGHARGRPDGRGARTPSAATCCSSASTSRCSSRCCRRRSSTTCCSAPAGPSRPAERPDS